MKAIKKNKLEDILREHRLKVTPQRVSVLKIFLSSESALSLQDLLKNLGKAFDRITLYRTLNSFEAHGLIHRIPDTSGNATYALCNHDTVEHSHNDHHVHFKCENCLSTFCLEDVEIPAIRLNKKFKAIKYNFLIEGICDACNR